MDKNKLTVVNKDNNIGKIIDEIKSYLESKIIMDCIKTTISPDVEKITIECQGSYKRHTATFSKNSKSDVDLIMYIGDYYTSNDIQFWKDKSLSIYTKHMSKNIKNNLEFLNSPFVKDNNYVEIKNFIILKNNITNLLINKFNNYKISNKNKCIHIETQNVNIDIVIAGKWWLKVKDNEYSGSNIIINNPPYEIQNLPQLNIDNIEEKAKNCKNLYEIIRIFKNFNYLLKTNIPSYHIECILYNIPNEYFNNGYDDDSINNICDYINNFILYKFYNNEEIFEINNVFILNKKIDINKIKNLINKIKLKLLNNTNLSS